MKRLSLIASGLAALIAAGLVVPNTASAQAALTVTVESIKEPKGALMIALFDNEEGYGKDAALRADMVPVAADKVTASFDGLKPGKYAIKMFHDVDGDGKMGTNPFGMPLEPFAFSNNAPARFGPATWADASFEVGASGAVQTIKLN